MLAGVRLPDEPEPRLEYLLMDHAWPTLYPNLGGTTMQVLVSARHGDLCQATQDKIAERAGRISRNASRLSAICITVDLQSSDKPHVTGHAFTNHAAELVASHTSSNLWASLDHVLGSLKRKLQKRKDRLSRRRQKSYAKGISMERHDEALVAYSRNDAVDASYPRVLPTWTTDEDDPSRHEHVIDQVKGMRQLFEDSVSMLQSAKGKLHEVHASVCEVKSDSEDVACEAHASRVQFHGKEVECDGASTATTKNETNQRRDDATADGLQRTRQLCEGTARMLDLATCMVEEAYLKACGLLHRQRQENQRLGSDMAAMQTVKGSLRDEPFGKKGNESC